MNAEQRTNPGPILPGQPVPEAQPAAAGKERHGCLTAWLVLMIIMNSVFALAYLLTSGLMKKQFPMAPDWAWPVLALAGFVNAACAAALLRWKKWGFMLFCATAVVGLFVNRMVGLGIVQNLLGLLGVVILFALLQIGGEKKAWTQLE